jgi:hypothetical protein
MLFFSNNHCPTGIQRNNFKICFRFLNGMARNTIGCEGLSANKSLKAISGLVKILHCGIKWNKLAITWRRTRSKSNQSECLADTHRYKKQTNGLENTSCVCIQNEGSGQLEKCFIDFVLLSSGPRQESCAHQPRKRHRRCAAASSGCHCFPCLPHAAVKIRGKRNRFSPRRASLPLDAMRFSKKIRGPLGPESIEYVSNISAVYAHKLNLNREKVIFEKL